MDAPTSDYDLRNFEEHFDEVSISPDFQPQKLKVVTPVDLLLGRPGCW